jgi:hypothetical protein
MGSTDFRKMRGEAPVNIPEQWRDLWAAVELVRNRKIKEREFHARECEEWLDWCRSKIEHRYSSCMEFAATFCDVAGGAAALKAVAKKLFKKVPFIGAVTLGCVKAYHWACWMDRDNGLACCDSLYKQCSEGGEVPPRSLNSWTYAKCELGEVFHDIFPR